MGQEASLPQDTTGGGVEPGLDPPSQIPPPSSPNNGDRSTRASARPGKALKQMFHRSTHNNMDNSHGRDTARVAAEGGHLDPSTTPARQNQFAYAQPPPQQQYYGDMPPPPPVSSSQPYAEIGLMYTSSESSSQRGLGANTGRGAGKVGKKLMNSMRNLAVGPSRPAAAPTGLEDDGIYKTTGLPPHELVPPAAPPPPAGNWEQQWDEDSESDDEDEPIFQQQPSHNRAISGDLLGLNEPRPGMDVAHANATPGSPVRTPLPVAAMSPPTSPGQAAELISTHPVKPEMLQDDGVEWDTGVQVREGEQYEKPNVEMFLPMLRVLGKGSFGKVVLVQKRRGKETGQLYAMKILRKTHLLKRRQIERTRTERKVLSVVDHPFIMKLHYAFQSDDKLYLVLDYCPGGELFFHLSRFRRFPERVARFYSAELLLALGHLHKRGIIYRDLKPENVLLDADGHVKLGDFGLAKAGIRHPCEGALSMCGTPEYMAPEVLSQAGHGFCVDYWGLGMLMYEMMTGLPPWYTTDRAKLFRRLKSAPLDIPSYFSGASAECIGGLLERNPRRRLGVSGIRSVMEQQFFRNMNWRALYARRVESPIKPCESWSMKDVEDDQPGHEILEKATANFDSTFTRMPVESDGTPENPHDDDSEFFEELHPDSFVGFTYDDDQKEHKEDPPVPPARPRTHHTAE